MPKKRALEERAGRFAYEGLDRVLHERARLGILAALVATPGGVRFGELRRLCALSDGNLNRHLDVLRRAGVLEIWKGFENRRPHTVCRLTAAGRARFAAYLGELRRVVRDSLPKASRRAGRLPAMPEGWFKS